MLEVQEVLFLYQPLGKRFAKRVFLPSKSLKALSWFESSKTKNKLGDLETDLDDRTVEEDHLV
jgi:hypothetical protein